MRTRSKWPSSWSAVTHDGSRMASPRELCSLGTRRARDDHRCVLGGSQAMTTPTIRPFTLTDLPSRWLYGLSGFLHGRNLKALRDLYTAEWRRRGYWGFP